MTDLHRMFVVHGRHWVEHHRYTRKTNGVEHHLEVLTRQSGRFTACFTQCPVADLDEETTLELTPALLSTLITREPDQTLTVLRLFEAELVMGESAQSVGERLERDGWVHDGLAHRATLQIHRVDEVMRVRFAPLESCADSPEPPF